MRQWRGITTMSAWPLFLLASSPTFINFHSIVNPFEDVCVLLSKQHYAKAFSL